MTGLLHSLLSQEGPPAIPASVAVARLDSATSTARVSARQTTLEPSSAGVDSAMSWSCWINQSNVGTQSMRIFGVGMVSSGDQQYVLQTFQQDIQDAAFNQKLNFTIFTDGSNYIAIDSTNIFLRNRWTHVVITYSGSETVAGIKMYINGVEDTTRITRTGGTYTGARNNANNRFMVSRVDASSTKYGGDLRDLVIWNRVLTGAEITELFNSGLPVTVSGVSFYAGAIRAWWPLQSDVNNVNNASFNLTSSAGIAFTSRPLAASFEQITFFNSNVLNTRYVAFGGMYKTGKGRYVANTRSGTNHLANGKIVKISFNSDTLTPSAPVDIITDGTYDLRNISTGIIDGDIAVIAARYTNTTGPFIDVKRYMSTDGRTGESFDSGTTVPTTLDTFQPYGKIIKGNVQGEYLSVLSEADAAFAATEINLLKRSTGGVWSKSNVWTGSTDAYVEPCICKVGANTYFIMARSEAINGLHLFYSTDGANTWSGPFDTGVGTGRCMADMAMDPAGGLTLVYADRGTNRLIVSSPNVVADIIADPTDWLAGSEVFKSYSTDSTTILGYPTVVYDGWKICICVSAEFSSTRADLYWAYGVLG